MQINKFSKYININNPGVKVNRKIKANESQDTFTFSGSKQNNNDGQWIVFPCFEKDPVNYEDNAKSLKKIAKKGIYSGRYYTKDFLRKYTYHVYMIENKPALLICTEGKVVKELRSNNNGTVNDEYLEILNKYITANKLKTSKRAETSIKESKERRAKYNKILLDLNSAIKTQNAEEIFNYFGIKTDTDRHGDMTISEYKQPDKEITFQDLGIDESKLLSRVVTVEGDADFRKSALTSTGAVEYIGGNAIFSSSKITSLDKLEVIEGNACFNASKIRDIGNLEYIGGNANFRNSGILSLKNLEHIGKNAFFRDSKVKDLGKLNYIGGKITFINSPLNKRNFNDIKRKG